MNKYVFSEKSKNKNCNILWISSHNKKQNSAHSSLATVEAAEPETVESAKPEKEKPETDESAEPKHKEVEKIYYKYAYRRA